MRMFYRAGGSGSDTTAIFVRLIKSLFCFLQHFLGCVRATNIQHRIPHGFECPRSPVCPGLQRAHVLFQAAGLVIKPFRCGLVRCLQCPASSPEPLQQSSIRNLLRRHVMELARHRRQPRRRVSGPASRRLQRPCPPPRRMQRRNAPHSG